MLSFKNNLVSVGTACSGLLKPAASLLYTGLISFIFSSLLLFDLPGITEGVASLRRSRLRRPYEELAPKLRTFGKLVGQGTQVQALIAIVNTVLTTLGLFVLKIPGTRFLSLVTHVCSFSRGRLHQASPFRPPGVSVRGAPPPSECASLPHSTAPMALAALSEYA